MSALEGVEEQYESVTELYNIVTRCCVSKCQRDGNPPVKVGEALCLDRCVAKFFAASEAISKVMTRYQEQQQQQAQAAQQVAGGTSSFTSVLGL